MSGRRAGPRCVASFVAGVGALLIVGCGAHRPALVEDSAPRREATLPELERLLADRASVGSYRALVTLAVESADGSASVRGTVAFTAPKTFVVRGLDPLGRDLFALTAEGEDVRLEGDGPAIVGAEAIDAGLARWLGTVRVADVLRVLGASHGVVVDPLDVVALERGEDRYALYFLVVDGGRARFERKVLLERTRFLPVSEEWFDAKGSGRFRVRFDRYAEVAGAWRPLSVTASSGAGTLRVEYQEIIPASR